MKRKTFILALIISLSFIRGTAMPADTLYFSPEDKTIYNQYISYIQKWSDKPRDTIIIRTALFFLGTPYVGHTLEKEPEGLVINLRELDCTTFVENVYSLATTVMSGDMTFENYCRTLRTFRFRNDTINDYTDRLHYTSDWIFENQKKGHIKNVSRKCGGKRLHLNLYIMSSTTDSYKQLADKPELIEKVIAKEKEINSRKHFYLPTKKIDRRRRRILSGDMVGFVTTIPGIDISHMGIVYKQGKKLTFIHASSSYKKVIINESTLSEYVAGTGRNTGIVLAR